MITMLGCCCPDRVITGAPAALAGGRPGVTVVTVGMVGSPALTCGDRGKVSDCWSPLRDRGHLKHAHSTSIGQNNKANVKQKVKWNTEQKVKRKVKQKW